MYSTLYAINMNNMKYRNCEGIIVCHDHYILYLIALAILGHKTSSKAQESMDDHQPKQQQITVEHQSLAQET